MQDTDWITVVSELEQQLLTAIYTVKELRADMEYRRSTRPAPEQLAMPSEPATIVTPVRRPVIDPARARRAWTSQETERAVYLWMRGTPLSDIADELERTERGVECQMSKLRMEGISLPKRDRLGRNL